MAKTPFQPSPQVKHLVSNASATSPLGAYALSTQRHTPVLDVSLLARDAGGDYVVDPKDMRPPQRRFAAEVCAVQFRHSEVRLVFGQEDLIGEGLEAALIVRLSVSTAVQLLQSIDLMHSPSLNDIARALKLKAAEPFRATGRPAQSANVVSNISGIAISGFDTCIDFYHASAFAVYEAKDHKEMTADAIVRVDLRTELFLTLVAELRTVLAQVPASTLTGD